MTGEPETMYTVKEVATILKVSPEAVQSLIRQGRLKAIKIGGRIGYRVRKTDLDTFMDESATKVAAA